MLSDRVEAVNQQVNAFDIDAVVKHLRSVTLHYYMYIVYYHCIEVHVHTCNAKSWSSGEAREANSRVQTNILETQKCLY